MSNQKYERVTLEERKEIHRLKGKDYKIRRITRWLNHKFNKNRSHTTVSRELKRTNYDLLSLVQAEKLAYARRSLTRYGKDSIIMNDVKIFDYVIEKLERNWSPARIAKNIKRDLGASISHQTIHNFRKRYRNTIKSFGKAEQGAIEELRKYANHDPLTRSIGDYFIPLVRLSWATAIEIYKYEPPSHEGNPLKILWLYDPVWTSQNSAVGLVWVFPDGRIVFNTNDDKIVTYEEVIITYEEFLKTLHKQSFTLYADKVISRKMRKEIDKISKLMMQYSKPNKEI